MAAKVWWENKSIPKYKKKTLFLGKNEEISNTKLRAISKAFNIAIK